MHGDSECEKESKCEETIYSLCQKGWISKPLEILAIKFSLTWIGVSSRHSDPQIQVGEK